MDFYDAQEARDRRDDRDYENRVAQRRNYLAAGILAAIGVVLLLMGYGKNDPIGGWIFGGMFFVVAAGFAVNGWLDGPAIGRKKPSQEIPGVVDPS